MVVTTLSSIRGAFSAHDDGEWLKEFLTNRSNRESVTLEELLECSLDDRGRIAAHVHDLSPADRMEIAQHTTPEWRGYLASYGKFFLPGNRMELAEHTTPEWRGEIACVAEGLTLAQRMKLAQDREDMGCITNAHIREIILSRYTTPVSDPRPCFSFIFAGE